jgi:hypothetical protein
METYKINITKSEASERAKSVWLTRRKNGNTKWGRPFIKGQKSWNTSLTSKIDIRVNKWLNENGYRIVRFWEHEIHSINFSQMLKNKI